MASWKALIQPSVAMNAIAKRRRLKQNEGAMQVDESKLPELTKDFEQAFGSRLVSLSLHGAGVPLWWPANLVVVLFQATATALHPAHAILGRWRRRGLATPLFLTRADLDRSLDAFPLEFFHLKLDARLLSGADHFQALEPEPEMLRLQCERELKGRAIALRQAYAASTLREELQALIAGSLPLFLGVFRGLLHLRGQTCPLPPAELLAAAAKDLKVKAEVFQRLAEVAQGAARKPSADALHTLVGDYLAECERLATLADELHAQGGGQETPRKE